jgi:phosphoribosylaminoimidazole-succinocarboxamide synthase
MDDVAKQVGPELAAQVKDVALKLYARGVEVMRKRGLILLDTKYEFGLDENGKLFVIDEVNTPDSSRMCSIAEYESKWARIQKEGLTPELKIKEFSKQYVRDTLLDLGFDGTKALKLPPSVVVECAYRYISVYEQITGEKFEFPKDRVRGTMGKNLQAAGLISGGCVAILAGSDSDKAHMDKLSEGCS